MKNRTFIIMNLIPFIMCYGWSIVEFIKGDIIWGCTLVTCGSTNLLWVIHYVNEEKKKKTEIKGVTNDRSIL